MEPQQPILSTRATLLIFSLPVFALLAAFVGYLWLTTGESFEEYYASYSDAIADGAIGRGWLPGTLPPSSRHIRQYGDIDTNSSFGSFEFDPKEWPSFHEKLRPATDIGNLRIDEKASCAPDSNVPLARAGFLTFRETSPGGYVIAVKPQRGCALFSNGI